MELSIARSRKLPEVERLLELVETSLDDDQAESITTIPLAGKSSIADYMVVASGRNARQIAAMANHLATKLKAEGGRVVALEARGNPLDSAGLARQLGRWRDQGARDVAFLIGGADGLDPTVTEAADLVLSLGAMTWPHALARVMLAEQLYRAETILSGHPYHRE